MKVRLKAPAEQAAGRQLQELVYYLWRGVQYARGWVRGSNPLSPDQVLARAAFSTITKRWETLDESVREGWATWAAANLVVDSLGREVRMPALAAYVRVNSIKYAMAGTYQDSAPTSAAPSPFTGADSVVSDSGDCSILSPTHGYTTLTGLKSMVKNCELASPAVAMTPRKGVLFAGYKAASFHNLGASGATIPLLNARRQYLPGAVMGLCMQIVNSEGLCSLPFTIALEVESV